MSLASKSPSLSALSTLLRQTPRSTPRLYQLQARSIATKQHRAITALAATNATYIQRLSSLPHARQIHQTAARFSIMPDAENPPPKESEPSEQPTAPAEVTDEEYHQLADSFLEELIAKLEEMQESRSDVDVEYAAGVLTVELVGKGTYVINKQPPNKQIWLSSPLTGPKRYDWVVLGESINQKADGGVGDWVYLRDGSSLTDLLKEEVGVNLGIDEEIA